MMTEFPTTKTLASSLLNSSTHGIIPSAGQITALLASLPILILWHLPGSHEGNFSSLLQSALHSLYPKIHVENKFDFNVLILNGITDFYEPAWPKHKALVITELSDSSPPVGSQPLEIPGVI